MACPSILRDWSQQFSKEIAFAPSAGACTAAGSAAVVLADDVPRAVFGDLFLLVTQCQRFVFLANEQLSKKCPINYGHKSSTLFAPHRSEPKRIKVKSDKARKYVFIVLVSWNL